MHRFLQRWLDRKKLQFVQLREVSLFQNLNRRELQEVEQHLTEHTYSKGGVIFEQGAAGDGVYVVLQGRVAVLQKDGEDGAPALLSQSESGSFFGETALLDDAPRTAAAVAREDVRLAFFSRDALRKLAERRPRLGVKLASQLSQIIAERLRHTHRGLQVAREELAKRQKRAQASPNNAAQRVIDEKINRQTGTKNE